MSEFITAGGPFMWPLLACSVLIITISIERSWFLQNRLVSPKGLSNQIMNLVKNELMEAGMSAEHIHFELFVTGLSKEIKKEANPNKIEKKEEVALTIIDGGKEFHFGMTNNDDNVLDAALIAGADLPFACKGGVCSTCKCRVIEGSVKMKVNYALDEKEVSEQFVLSCQAVPTSKKVILNFDV